MAFNSYKTFLMRGIGGSWAKLIDIKTCPDLEQPPEMLDATTLSDPQRTRTPGIKETSDMQFTANYDLDQYMALKALEGQVIKLAVWLGGTEVNGVPTPTGNRGKFEFESYITVTKNGAGVNEVHEMTITATPTTAVTQTEGTTQSPSVTLDAHSLELGVGETYTFTAVTVPAGKAVTYVSSATGKATVSAGGEVEGKQAGSAIITATITDGGVDYTDTCTVVVS